MKYLPFLRRHTSVFQFSSFSSVFKDLAQSTGLAATMRRGVTAVEGLPPWRAYLVHSERCDPNTNPSPWDHVFVAALPPRADARPF